MERVRFAVVDPPHAAGCEGVADVAGVGHGPGEAVEFGDDEGVTGSDCGQRLVESGRSRLVSVRPWSR
ncbi:hypothetical protein EV644_13174 [Kribbella orskensis]|uniref:Uncharacterized protein n=1 Tax=Kribbella orskensis TaxID=2512216 RepID=A0ABY2B8J1_9ACTN|nr:hypothetical protein EV642_13374 [Kribbella sp. VKM Ac-2500]TCO11411.1 hypothetical protein EV644_13174 [Kribbella orskensis]